MASTSTSNLAIFELVIYVILLPPSILALAKHGLRNLAGWLFLSTFIMTQLIGAALVIAAGKDGFSIAGTILIQIGLSPLLLAVELLLAQAIKDTPTKRLQCLGVAGAFFFHIAVVAPAVLLAYGTSQLLGNGENASTGATLQKAGAVLFLVVWLYLSCLVVFCVVRYYEDPACQRWLILACVFTLPLLAIRIIYSLLAVFDASSDTFSLVNGSLVARLLMLILPLMGTAVALVAAGVCSRPLKDPETQADAQNTRSRAYGDKSSVPRVDEEATAC